MADKNSKTGADETEAHLDGIDDVDWGSDDDVSAPSSSAPTSKSSVFDEDDPFSDAGPTESFFEIEQMPDSTSADDGLSDDFGDLQSDGDDGAYAPPAAASAGQDEDPFADDPFGDDDQSHDQPVSHDGGEDFVDDPFSDVSDASSEDVGQAVAAEAPTSGQGVLAKHRNLLLGVVGVAAAAVAVVYGAPMFLGGGPAVTVTQPAPIQTAENTFPTTLPTQSTAGRETAPVAATPPVFAPPAAVEKPAQAPSAPTLSIDLPAAPSTGLPALPATATQPADLPAAKPPVLVKTDPVDDLVGGSDRGGIDAVKTPVVAAPPSAAPSDGRDYAKELDALIARFDALEGKVDKLADGFDAVIQANGPAAREDRSQVAEVPAAASSDVVPPMKPPIVEAASLKGVAGDLAWISTKSGVVEVRVGDSVPNAGKVVAIRNYRDQWIVVTTDGLIVRQ